MGHPEFMTSFLLDFLRPYLVMQLGMTYSLQQSLEGLGINKTQFEPWTDQTGSIAGTSISVDASLGLPLLAIVALSVMWFVIAMMALRALWGRLAMWLGMLFMLMPGLFSIAGAWPEIQWLPRSYVIGPGYVGSPWGMLLLQGFAITTGWALIVWLSCRLRLDDRFRHGYDQFWYALAISAGLFFVADLDANDQRENLRESAATSRAASSYLLDQVRHLDEACESGVVMLPLACEWARTSQWWLDSYAHYGERLYWQLGPEQEWSIYTGSSSTPDDKVVDALRHELHQYNLLLCPVTHLGEGISRSSRVSRFCQMPPADFCISHPSRHLSGVSPIEARSRTVAIANECVVPTLYRLKVQQASLAASVADNSRARHLRTLFFILVAFVAGGKVANASVRMTDAIRKDRSTRAAGIGAPQPTARLCRLLSSLTRRLRVARLAVQRHTKRYARRSK